MDSIWLMLLLQLVLIGLNAVFACAEIAVISTNAQKLEQMAAKGNKRAKRLLKLTEQPARFLATIQVAITLSGFLGSAFAADNFSGHIVDWVVSMGVKIPVETLDTIAVILITLILSFFTLVLGELVPKRIAMRKAESLALGISGPVYFISKIFAPLVWLLTASTNGILRLCRIDPNETEENVSEEDIRLMVDAGTIDNEEKEFIRNIFEFDDMTADEIATHRTEVDILWLEESPEEWDKTIKDSRHTYFPICDETIDKVVGVLNAKDYFRLEDLSRESVMQNAVRAPYFVPVGVKADVLFRNMKKEHINFAVVMDEYGGLLGILTMNDLIEELVGDINYDESDDTPVEEPDVVKMEDGSWQVRGSVTLEELEKALDVELAHEDCDTLSGLALATLGTIPQEGDGFEVETAQLKIRALEVMDHQVERAIVSLIPTEQESDDE